MSSVSIADAGTESGERASHPDASEAVDRVTVALRPPDPTVGVSLLAVLVEGIRHMEAAATRDPEVETKNGAEVPVA